MADRYGLRGELELKSQQFNILFKYFRFNWHILISAFIYTYVHNKHPDSIKRIYEKLKINWSLENEDESLLWNCERKVYVMVDEWLLALINENILLLRE